MFAYTCQHGTVAEVKAALKRGADVNAEIVNETGLVMAVASKNNSVVTLLLKTPSIDVNWKDKGINGGWCALLEAVNWQNIAALKMLLSVPGIDMNIMDDKGRSAVHMAVKRDNVEALKLLLNHTS